MVDEREDRYENDEGEYHFSDDQVNYEEVDAPKAAQSTVSIKKSILEKFSGLSGSRRMLLAGVVFISLIGIIYKMLLPSSPVLPGEISAIGVAKKTGPEVATTKPVQPVSPPAQAPPVVQAPQPVMSAAPEPQPQTVTSPPIQQNASSQPGIPTLPGAPQMVSQQQSMYPATQAQQAPPAAPTQTGGLESPPPSASVSVSQDRLKAVEDHNAAIMNLLQTEYAQKMSEFEMQSNLVRGKMDEMAKRVNRIESSLNQITQLLQQNGPRANKSQTTAMESVPALPTRSAVPRVTYTVQAIIPGRAWLKADSGDTVTVAEGDTLRDYGRITKIDPYDGVVEIDTGNKIIALSYGMSGE
jgi:hypothetical protein